MFVRDGDYCIFKQYTALANTAREKFSASNFAKCSPIWKFFQCHNERQICSEAIEEKPTTPLIDSDTTLSYRVVQKNGPLVYFDDNFGKYGPIWTIFSLLQQEIYGTQNLSYYSHLTFIMLLHFLAKQTLTRGSVFWTTLYVSD